MRVEAANSFIGSSSPTTPFLTVIGSFGQEPKVIPGTGILVAQPVLCYLGQGKGDGVTRGVRPEVRYVETDWKTGAVIHDSWRSGAAQETLPTTGPYRAAANYLNGVSLGSRVEIVNPTGDGDARVLVVDVIAQGQPTARSTR